MGGRHKSPSLSLRTNNMKELFEQLELLLDIEDLKEYGLAEEEILSYIEWDSEMPILKSKGGLDAN